MTECGNVTSSVRVLGIDIGSSQVKAAVVCLGDATLHEVAVAERPTTGLGAPALVAAALGAAAEVLRSTGLTVAAVGIASMAETGALVDRAGAASGPLLRWDRDGDPHDRLRLAGALDPMALHAATGAPLVPKLPLLTWAALARDGLAPASRWAFAADLVAAALTFRVATDHTLAGRSGAFPLPASGAPLETRWDESLLDAVGVHRDLPPEVLAPGEPVGVVGRGLLPGAAGAPVHLAGHDHAVAAYLAGLSAARGGSPGTVVHSLGTTEAVLALARPGSPVDRGRAAAEGISVVRAVDGRQEGVLAGSPAAGALLSDWRGRAEGAGADPAALLAAPGGVPGSALALPYPRGRQSPRPDADARYLLLDADGDPASELTGILRGIAAHGAWMRAAVAELTDAGAHPELVGVGTPVRRNDRLAALMGHLAGMPLPVADLDAPVASGAAALAAERAGLAGRIPPPIRVVAPHDDGMPGLADRFAAEVAAHDHHTQGAR